MSQSEITLNVYGESGLEQQVTVDSPRFTIGRLPENDLAIDDSNLSRRHAIIESFNESVQISDCGSQNGTLVNGKPIAGVVQLADGDVIVLGGSKKIAVSMLRASAFSSEPISPANFSNQAAGTNHSASVLMPTWLNAPVVAGSSVVLILIVTVILLALNSHSEPTPARPLQPKPSQSVLATGETLPPQNNADPVAANNAAANQDITSVTNTNLSPDADELRTVEKHARVVMSSISSDRSPFLPEDVIRQINENVKSYRGSSTLSDGLRIMKQREASQLAEAAKSNDIKLPLLVYATLAKMDRDHVRGDQIAFAQATLVPMSKLRVIFGTELANDSLLIVATLDQPPNGNFHPLQITLNKLAEDPRVSVTKIRTIWYLREQQKVSAAAYDLVLRFLAIGVIAQDPRHFGVDAEPLVY